MSALRIGTELRRFRRDTLPPLALAVIMCLPLIFGGLFVWAYQDPVGHLDRLPVALVNSDEGEIGREVAESLVDADAVDLHLLSAEEATDGVSDGSYYFAVEIPRNFSTAVASLESGAPEQATLNVVFNNTNGLIPTVLGNQITTLMLEEINTRLGEEITGRLLVGYGTIGEGLDEAADGAGQLAEGTGSAADGSAQLAAGSGQARAGAGELADGSTRLGQGAGEAADGAVRLAEGARRLDDGLATAADGSDRLADGLGQLQAATDRLASGAVQVSAGVDAVGDVAARATALQDSVLAPLVTLSTQLRQSGLPAAVGLADQVDQAAAQVREQGLNPGLAEQLTALQEGAREIATQLSDPVSQYRSGMDGAAAASQELATGLRQLKDGSAELVIGTRTLADGTSQLAAGTTQLTVGASALRDGLVELDTGSRALSSGLGELDTGAGELSLRLRGAADDVPRWEGDALTAGSRSAAQPVSRELTAHDMTTFGTGLAPFFLSLAMFMGATVMWMVLHPLQRRAVDSGTAPFRAVLASYLPGLVVGTGQALLVWTVLTRLIRIDVAHPVMLLFSLWGVSAVFVAVTQAVNAVVGATAGRVVNLILMALQLVSSGGLYPAETQPAFLRWVHTWDPMTFSVNLFRHAIIGGWGDADTRAVQAVLVLLGVGLGAWLVSSLAARSARTIMAKDLHPELTP
ncbi:YhgE/Pip domain-containing protein [Corynebacterium sp.]|uniref:YhgE/Pip domain-containing protein n=1 Tax=Corynebacterium sp. TaxID=1720 RepID=UPI0019C1E5B6|nr:YhgE/Pip domain-containing protein [Corynebacterium sp.]HHU68623.1 YhgE/Pip domain-containing protein [Corynebacterium sp.]